MRYQALATDYDGTLAHNGRVSAKTVDSLQALLATGRRLIMVTGRELPELLSIFPQIDLFEWVVAENGALLYRPSTKEEKPLADSPPANFLRALAVREVKPISIGRVIVATWEPHETAVLETIHELGIEWQVIFNKGAVMVLPTGVNKASGLKAALKEMGLSPHNVVGVGDAENDHAFLKLCEFSAAVANALPAVKDTADMATVADHGDGVSELIRAIIKDDLAGFEGPRRYRRQYAEGELPPECSFYFRGPHEKLNLRAHNLTVFLQLAEGVDDEAWDYHLRRGDYSEWFAECVKDEKLSAAAQKVEAIDDIDPDESRAMIRAAIERDYIVLTNAPLPASGAN